MKRRKAAFTLIELLVVIAIIAILAAILFPVFAQAKAAAKSAVCVSNLKQQTLGVLMYTNDYDDTFPQGQVNFEGEYGYFWAGTGFIGYQLPCGAGEFDCNFEGNSIQPYLKNLDIDKCPSVIGNFNPYGYSSTSGAKPSSYTYNGDLHAYSATGVSSPVLTVMFWSGTVDNSWLGRTVPAPNLGCPLHEQSTCTYQPNPTGAVSSTPGTSDYSSIYGAGNYQLPSYSKWVHNQGDNMSNCDGHVKFHHLSGSIKEDPWADTGPNGQIYIGSLPSSNTSTLGSNSGFPMWTNGPGGHTCLFGPDDPCGL
jgi:prepilin-type N-terminal cleavage/methylation domain-containing protein